MADLQEIWDLSGRPNKVSRDLAILIGMSLIHNERFYPLEEVGIQYRAATAPGDLKSMDTQSLQRSMSRVTHREGIVFSASMRWWKIIFIMTSLLGLLSSLVISFAWMPAHNVLSDSLLVKPGLIPIWLVVAFNLGLLGRKLASFGWPRLRRLLSLRVSRNQSVKDWLDDGPSRTDSINGIKSR
jgi:hypothetical protein